MSYLSSRGAVFHVKTAQCCTLISGDVFLQTHTGKKYYLKIRIPCKIKHKVDQLICACGFAYIFKVKAKDDHF